MRATRSPSTRCNRPVTPADLFMTAFEQLGIGTPELTTAGLLPLGRRLRG